MLKVQSLQKRYGSRLAVRDLTFSVREGEVYGLLGPNGAGKSSTLKVLSGLAPPDGGEVTVAGHSVRSEANVVKRLIGIVPQE
ncbi:MAG TPA: ATP-binding cassette domain-containing protein, partial [Deinococcales bacterium]|nr:ATP-binding cassette domain-containing protein [Deinococcales bacterium]